VIVGKEQASQSAHIEVVAAAAKDESVLANLLELYIHDFSEFLSLELGLNGRFGYGNLPLYWRESNRHPFLVLIDGKLAGFVLVKRGSEVTGNQSVWDMAEFFVVRGHRRRGIGTEVAHQVWRRFRGLWEIRVIEANRSSHHFWERAIAVFVGEPICSVPVQNGDKSWRVFSFESVTT
jgi:predicted acetyltransferase